MHAHPLLLLLLTTLMAATRLHHFAAIPDASWAVFFLGGFYLRQWAFVLLMALAVAVDALVIGGQGTDFWNHNCLSPGYWMLLPAHAALWLGGRWLQRRLGKRLHWSGLGPLAISVVVSSALCHLFAQGGFYWTSPVVADPTLPGWWKNWSDWYPPYLWVMALYVGMAASVHVALGHRATGQVAHKS